MIDIAIFFDTKLPLNCLMLVKTEEVLVSEIFNLLNMPFLYQPSQVFWNRITMIQKQNQLLICEQNF